MTFHHHVLLVFVATVLLAACQPKPEGSTTPVEETGSLEPCKPRFQATKAYVTFAEPPHDDVFYLGPQAAEEVISSLRASGCDPRPDLREHADLVDALRQGALVIATITYIGDLPNAAEVVVKEAKLGDATAPDARSFALRVHRSVPFTMEDTKLAHPAPHPWRITAVSVRSN